MASTFRESGFTPAAEMTRPRKVSSVAPKTYLAMFSLRTLSLMRLRTCVGRASWASLVSAQFINRPVSSLHR